MIEVSELTRRFGAVTAVDRLSFHLGPGIVGFLGPNGAGKTTTLRVLAGALAPTAGVARVAGFDVFGQADEARARVGWLPETPPLWPELTVGETLRFVAEARGIDRSRRAARVGEVLEEAGLRGDERRRVGELSKGARQRVGLAQALVHDPEVLLLDEPTTGLDPTQVPELRARIRSLAGRRTVLLSTHVLSEVEALCDRILVLHRGALRGDGTAAELARAAGLTDEVELQLDRADADPAAVLAALPEVVEVRSDGPLRVWLRGGPALEPAVAAAAAGRGWPIRRLARRAPGLEQAFLALVGR